MLFITLAFLFCIHCVCVLFSYVGAATMPNNIDVYLRAYDAKLYKAISSKEDAECLLE